MRGELSTSYRVKYGVSAGQDFDNLAEDASLLLIKKEGLQREIAAMEREKQKHLGQNAAATNPVTSKDVRPVALQFMAEPP
ncbi:MAG: hypothetical protein Q8Q45_00135 [Methylococcaceae bacterium]|nr:hypothetical protein [Methylococcaceae bacterium]MDP3930736.1 hypothetical protein [Methylococcaceae bacterium]